MLEDHRISDQSIGEQLLTHVSWFDPSVTKIWTCRRSPRSGSPNDWTRIKKFNGAIRLSKFWNFLGAIQKFPAAFGDHGRNLVISLWCGDKATINAVAAWQHIPPTQNFHIQKSTGKSLASIFFGKKDGIVHIDYLLKGPNHQRGVFLVSACTIEAHIEGKKPGNFTKCVLFFHDNVLSHRALATQKKLAKLGFHCLIHQPSSWYLAPSENHLLIRLKFGMVAILRPTRRSLLPRKPGCTDNILIFIEWFWKVIASGYSILLLCSHFALQCSYYTLTLLVPC